MMKAEDNNSSLKWNQHPLISTVLWMLGTDLMPSNNSNNGESDKHNAHTNVVGWKDEQGGSITEYFNHIQIPSSSSSRSETTRSAELPLNLQEMKIEDKTPMISNPSHTQNGSGNSNSTAKAQDHYTDNENGFDINASPQWGFYVPITPPQQELFTKNEKITIQTIQADQRKRQ